MTNTGTIHDAAWSHGERCRQRAADDTLDGLRGSDIARWCARNGLVLCSRDFVEQVAALEGRTVTFTADGGVQWSQVGAFRD